METSTLVSVDDIVEMLPRLGEPLPEAEVVLTVQLFQHARTHAIVCTSGYIFILQLFWRYRKTFAGIQNTGRIRRVNSNAGRYVPGVYFVSCVHFHSCVSHLTMAA